MSGWTTVRTILESLNFVAGVAVACFAAIALRQISIAKATARMNAKREAFKLAADQCTFYLNHVIPLLNNLDHLTRDKNLTFFKSTKVRIEGETIIFEKKPSLAELQALNTEAFASVATKAFNALEAFAVFFTSGVADDGVAFSSVGFTFCHSLNKLVPYLAMIRPVFPNYYNNLWKLFFLWNGRLASGSLEKEREKLQKQQETLEKRLADISTTPIAPLGTEE